MEWLSAIKWDNPAIFGPIAAALVAGAVAIVIAITKRKKRPDDGAGGTSTTISPDINVAPQIEIDNKPTVKIGLDEKAVGQEVSKAVAAEFDRLALQDQTAAQIKPPHLDEVQAFVRDVGKEERRRVDAVAPSYARLADTIDLLVQVRMPDSEFLGIKDWPFKEKPESLEFASATTSVQFPIERQTGRLVSAKLLIRVVAPDFEIEGAAEKMLDVPPDQDSTLLSFLLTTRKRGHCRNNVEVYTPSREHIGTIPVATVVNGDAAKHLATVATLIIVVAGPTESSTQEPPAAIGTLRDCGLDEKRAISSFVFDVFLSHNSKDKPAIRELKAVLSARGLNVWLDEDELRPGLPWPKLLEEGIRASGSVAVLVAKDGLGPWEDEEMQAALRMAVKDKRPVIPVLLPGASGGPSLPMFLTNRTWVDLRAGFTDDGLAKLTWGITGEKPRPIEEPGSATPRLPSSTPRETGPADFLPDYPEPQHKWVGRRTEMDKLRRAWRQRRRRIQAVVGFGGEGKTALTRRFTESLRRRRVGTAHHRPLVVWWSFYFNKAADAFFAAALTHFGIPLTEAGHPLAAEQRARKLVDLLRTGVKGRRLLLILDGLETLQDDTVGREGRVTDTGLRELLRATLNDAEPDTDARGMILISTREPLLDLRRDDDPRYGEITLEELSVPDGAALLTRQYELKIEQHDAQRFVKDVGGHALTLTLTGALHAELPGTTSLADLRRFIAGEEAKVTDPELTTRREKYHRLPGYVLRHCADVLNERERQFLRLLSCCVRPATRQDVEQVFLHPLKGEADDQPFNPDFPDGLIVMA